MTWAAVILRWALSLAVLSVQPGRLHGCNERLTDKAADYRVWPFDKPFYLILNLAVGGFWGGEQGVDLAIWPQRMEVDYVRVYKKKG